MTTPTAMSASTIPEPGARISPARTAMTAAIAPSVDAIAETTPTAPER